MNPFSRPSSNQQYDTPISPRTIPHNYNAVLGNHPVNTTPFTYTYTCTSTTGRPRPQSSRSSFHPTFDHDGAPIGRLYLTKPLKYSGRTLGKRRSQNYVRPPRPKRRCLASERHVNRPGYRDPQTPPTGGANATGGANPNPTSTTSATSSTTPLTSLTTTLQRDQYLSLLPPPLDTPQAFTALTWPPNPSLLPPYDHLHPYGDDYPGGFPTRIDLVHPLLRKLVLPQGVWESSSYHTHSAYPELWRALQLATRFLSDRCSLALFWRILFEVPDRLDEESAYFGTDVWHLSTTVSASAGEGTATDGGDAADVTASIDTKFTAGHGLTEEQRVLTIDTLAALAPHIAFCFGQTHKGHWGHTERVEPLDGNAALLRRLNRAHLDTYQDSSTAASTAGHTLPHRPNALQPVASTPGSVSLPRDFTDESVGRTMDMSYVHTRALSVASGIADAGTGNGTGGLQGTNAKVTLNAIFLQYLHKDLVTWVPYHVKVYVLFFLAVTIVHEVAHAAWMCRVPKPPASAPWQPACSADAGDLEDDETMDIDEDTFETDYEPFIGDDRKAELGKAWEASVFDGQTIEPLGQCTGGFAKQIDESGGVVQWGDLFSLGLGCRIWPDTDETFVRVRYSNDCAPMARLWPLEEGGQPKSGARYECLRILPWTLIRRLFNTEFWDQVDSQPGGLKGVLQREIDPCVQVRRENAQWTVVRGAKAIDIHEYPDGDIHPESDEMDEEEAE